MTDRHRKIYSGLFKATVVFETFEGRQDLAQIAGKYDLHPNQIKNWRSMLKKRAAELFEDRRCGHRNALGKGKNGL